jgi:tetratricopeptide (TPR) repeat protein/DNA-binding CsgD family transcriptional regulator
MQDFEQQLKEATSPLERMKLIAESSIELVTNNHNRAGELIGKSLPLARKRMKLGEGRREYALLLCAWGLYCFRRSEFEQARKHFEEALPLLERLSDRRNVNRTVLFLGAVAASVCEYDKALEFFQRSKQLSEDSDDHANVLQSLSSIAGVYKRTGHYHKAMEQYYIALRLAADVGDKEAEANLLMGMGMIQNEQGNFDVALQSLFQALLIKENMGKEAGIAAMLLNIGNVYALIPDYRKAIEYYEKSLAIHERLGRFKTEAGWCFLNLGTMYLRLGELPAARTWLEKGLEVTKKIEDHYGYAGGLGTLAEVLLREGDLDAALESVQAALALMKQINEQDAMADALLTLGHIQSRTGDISSAIESIEQAIAMATTMGTKPVIRDAYELLSKIYREAGELPKALEYFERYHQLNEELLRLEADRRLQHIKLELEREQAEKREAMLTIENQRIERELDLKTKHLATMAMSIVQHSNFLNSVGKEIGDAAKKAPKTRKQPLDQLAWRVKQQSQSEQEWKFFEEQLDNLSPEVITRLAKRFPQLTPTELKICALIKIGLGSKEMASLMYVSLRSIETYRLRIRKKLKLKSDENLTVFLSKS